MNSCEVQRIAGIDTYDINNGTGFGVTLFVQGCSHHCMGCHNPTTWAFDGGSICTEAAISKLFDADDFGYTKVTMECPLYDEKGNKLIKRGVVQVDSKRRDTEIIPLKQDVDAYIKAEVLPYVPDAFPDRSKDKIGYEIPFTRYFYKYTPPRKSTEILKEIIANEEELQQTLKEVLK